MLKIPEPSFPPSRHHSDAGHQHRHSHLGGNHLGIPSRGPRSCQTCRDKIIERKRYLSKSREAIIEKATQSNLKKSLSKSRERLCDIRLTLSKSRDHLNAENLPKKLSRSQEKFCNLRSLSKSQEVLSASLSHAKKGSRAGAVSDMNQAQHMVTAIMNDTDNTLDLVLVPGGHVLMSHPDLLRTNSGSLQMLPITESGRSTPGSVCSISTVHDIQYGNHGMYVNPPDGCMVHGHNGSSNPPPAVVIATPTASEPPQIEPLLEVSEEEELETKSNASEGDEDNSNEIKNQNTNKRMDETSNVKQLPSSSRIVKENKRFSNASTIGTPPSKEEKETINYEKKQSMSRSASVDADIGRTGLAQNNNTNAAKHNKTGCSDNGGSSHSVNSKETASIGIQVNLMKSTSSPNLIRKHNSNEKVNIETMEIDIEKEINEKCSAIKEEAVLNTPTASEKSDKVILRRSSNASSQNRKESTGSFTHDSMLGDDVDKPNYAWREELAKFQSQKPLRVSKLIGTFDKSENDESITQSGNDSSKNMTALKKRRRGSLQIQFNEGILKDLANAGEEARKREAKEKEQRRKSTSSILMRNIENLKIQDKITDILDHGSKSVIEEKALEKTDVSEKMEDTNKNEIQHPKEEIVSKTSKKKETSNKHQISHSGLQEKQKIGPKQKPQNDSSLTKRTSSPYLDRKALQEQTNKGFEQKKKNWDYFEINHPKAISDKKLQELKAKYQRRRTEGTLVLERDKKVASDINDEKNQCAADTESVRTINNNKKFEKCNFNSL